MDLFLIRWKSRDPKTEAHGYDPAPGKPRGMIGPDFSIVRKHFIAAFTTSLWTPGLLAKRLYHIVMGSLEALPLLGPGLIKSEQVVSSFFERTKTLIRTEIPSDTKLITPKNYPVSPEPETCLQELGFVVLRKENGMALSYQNTGEEKLILSEKEWKLRGEKGILCVFREGTLSITPSGELFLYNKQAYTECDPEKIFVPKDAVIRQGTETGKQSTIAVLEEFGFILEEQNDTISTLSFLPNEKKSVLQTETGWILRDREIELCRATQEIISLSPPGIVLLEKSPIYPLSEHIEIRLETRQQGPRIGGLSGRECLERIGWIRLPDETFGFLETPDKHYRQSESGFSIINSEEQPLCTYNNGVLNLSFAGIKELGFTLQKLEIILPEKMEISLENCSSTSRIIGLSGRECLERIGCVKLPDEKFGFLETAEKKCRQSKSGFSIIDSEEHLICTYKNRALNLSFAGIKELGFPLQDFSSTILDIDLNTTEKFDANVGGTQVTFSYIGGGNFGKVYRGSLSQEKNIILKIIRPTRDFSVIEAINEYYLQEKAGTTGAPIVRTIGIGRKGSGPGSLICFLMEDAGENNLKQIITGELAPSGDYSVPDAQMRLKTLIFMLRQLFEGCEGLAGAGIVHRDLKPANLFCDAEKNLKIGDFGFATEERFFPKNCWGSRPYMAPETLVLWEDDNWSSSYQTTATDIYAAGLIVHQCITGEIPYDTTPSLGLGERNRIFRIYNDIVVKNEAYLSRNISPSVSVHLVDLVNGCCKNIPERRLTAREGIAILQQIEQRLEQKKNTEY